MHLWARRRPDQRVQTSLGPRSTVAPASFSSKSFIRLSLPKPLVLQRVYRGTGDSDSEPLGAKVCKHGSGSPTRARARSLEANTRSSRSSPFQLYREMQGGLLLRSVFGSRRESEPDPSRLDKSRGSCRACTQGPRECFPMRRRPSWRRSDSA